MSFNRENFGKLLFEHLMKCTPDARRTVTNRMLETDGGFIKIRAATTYAKQLPEYKEHQELTTARNRAEHDLVFYTYGYPDHFTCGNHEEAVMIDNEIAALKVKHPDYFDILSALQIAEQAFNRSFRAINSACNEKTDDGDLKALLETSGMKLI